MKLARIVANKAEDDILGDWPAMLTDLYEYLLYYYDTAEFPQIVSSPKGTKRESRCPLFEYEWIDTHQYSTNQTEYGTIYFPLQSGMYLAVNYAC